MSHAGIKQTSSHLETDLAELLCREYDLGGDLRRLGGEHDLNFELNDVDRGRWLVKVMSPSEPDEVTASQTAMLQWAGALEFVPEILPASSGALWVQAQVGEKWRGVRVVRFAEGTSSRSDLTSAAGLRGLGAVLARLDERLALHPGRFVETGHPWDIYRPEGAIALMHDGVPIEDAELIGGVLADYTERVLPVLRNMPAQLIHNDLNRDNVLTDGEEITAVLDFGDAVIAPRIVDVAVTCAYFAAAATPAELAESAGWIVAGYSSIAPLGGDELDLLYDLVLARCALALAIARSRARSFADDPTYLAYITRNTAATRERLGVLLDADRTDFRATIDRLAG